jgi:hypothetical protein
MNSVVQDWVSSASFKQQTVLLSALRGCDGKNKEDISKFITRQLRGVMLKNADSRSGFMHKKNMLQFEKRFDLLLKDIDSYPVHFILHLIHAFEVVGYYHDDTNIRDTFKRLYKKACYTFHMKPETKEEIDLRLSDNLERMN